MNATAALRSDAFRGLQQFSYGLLRPALFISMVCGAFAFIEPSPYEFAFAGLCLIVLMRGMAIPAVLAIPTVLLTLFNVGGVFSLAAIDPDAKQIQFVAVSGYLALTTIVLAMIVAEDPQRMRAVRGGYILAAVITSIAGIAGYFDIAGTYDTFTENSRARGMFKDPNVMGPFLILPVIYLVHDLLRGRVLDMVRALVPLGLICAAILLSFSRGAWGHTVVSVALFSWLLFVTSPSAAGRMRVVVSAFAAVIAAALMLGAMLTVPKVADLFEERAKLVQYYDGGSMGRFGKQRVAIPDLMKHPNGYGALEFAKRHGEDPHNVYVNAFASYGWLGGITYATFVLATLFVGIATIIRRTAVQHHAIAVFSVFAPLTLLGIVIDTDHWRHFYLLSGLVWGLYAASLRAHAPPQAS